MAEEKGIVLKKTKYSESDLILKILTRDGAILNLIAKSALRSKKRFGGGILEPTHYIQFEFDYKPDKLSVMNEAKLINDFSHLKKKYDSLMLGLQIVDIAARSAQEGEKLSENFYNLIGNALKSVPEQNIKNYQMMFFIKFLHSQGVLQKEPWMIDFLRLRFAEFHLLKFSADEERLNQLRLQTDQWVGTFRTIRSN